MFKRKQRRIRSVSLRSASIFAVLLLVFGTALPLLAPRQSSAAGLLSNRYLKISSSADGTVNTDSSGNNVCNGTAQGGCGAQAKHTIGFTLPAADTVGSILIIYCDNPILQTSCTTPTGFDASNLTNASVSVTGLAAGAFTLDTTVTNASLVYTNYGTCNGSGSTRTNCIFLRRTTPVAESSGANGVVAYGGLTNSYIKNPVAASNPNCLGGSGNCPFYARVLVFSDGDTTSGNPPTVANLKEAGSTAADINTQINVTAKVKEILNFSVGAGNGSVPGTSGTPPAAGATCAPINDAGQIYLGDGDNVLSTSTAYDTHSFFRVNSNTVNGTKIYYSGDTLKSGTQQIDPMGTGGPPPTTAVASAPGTKQFGLAVDTTSSNNSFTSLTATAPYAGGSGTITSGGTALFAFGTASITTPIEIASSTGGITCDTGDVRYIANVSTATAAGIYRTTITYIAVGTY